EHVRDGGVSAAVGIAMGQFQEQHNLLLTPTVAILPFEAGHDVPPGSGLQRWPQWSAFSFPFNMTGQPAISIPVGETAGGLPVGLQIVGPPHADEQVLTAGRFVEWLLSCVIGASTVIWPELAISASSGPMTVTATAVRVRRGRTSAAPRRTRGARCRCRRRPDRPEVVRCWRRRCP